MIDDFAGLAALSGIILVIVIIFAIILLLILVALIAFNCFGTWKLFEKAGQPGWKALIPFYNTWTLYEIAGLEWYWFLASISGMLISVILPDNSIILSIASLVCSIISIMARIGLVINLSKKLHKDTGWCVAAMVLQGIMIPIAGISKNYVWDKDAKVDKNSYLEKYFNKNK